MSHNEDCSAVLEQFIHDVANLPAEINHLMEEIQVKDTTMAECRSIINSRDNSIQRFIKMNGSLTPNPKEEAYTKAIAENLDKSIALQDEKIALAERASTLLDRQVKRLDVRLRDLVKEGLLANDPPLPSLLVPKQNQQQGPQQQQQQAASQQQPNLPAGGANASLKYLSGHVPSGLANSTSAQGGNGRNSSFSSLSGAQATPRSSLNQQARPFSPGATAAGAPGSAAAMHLQRQREASMSGSDAKRRRISSVLGASTGISGVGSTPAAPSGLRQSSAGPGAGAGTASTGGATGARAGAGAAAAGRSGSAGPKSGTALKKTGAGATKKVAPHQQVKKIKIASGGSTKTKGVGA
ncbi:Histone acetyltransferase complex subunit, partial [Ascosphaera atra]